MKHTPHRLLARGGRRASTPRPPLAGDARGRRRRRRRRLHGDVGRLAPEGARARGAGRPARGEPICGHGPSGRNGGFCNVMWFSLPNMRERWGDAAALAVGRGVERGGRRGSASSARREGVDAWYRHGGYLQVSTAPAQDGIWTRGRRRLPRARGRGDASQALSADGGRRALQLARLPRRRLLRRLGDGAAGAAGARPARPPASPPASRSTSARRCGRLRAAPRRGRGADRRRHGPGRRGGGRDRRRRARAGAARCAAGSPSPPPTSSSPSRCRTCSRRSAGPAASASPTAARCSTTSAPPRTAGSPSAGAAAGSRSAPASTAAPSSTARWSTVAATQLRRLLPGLERARDHPRLGRPDRRLADPPAAGDADCAAAAPSSPPATPATASAPRTWSAGRWPRSPSTAATSTHGWPSSTPRPPASPPSPSTGSAAKRSATGS